MIEKLPHRHWGSRLNGIVGYITRAISTGNKKRVSPARKDEERFERDARDQLIQLKNKGLSIPVFTL